MSDKVACTSCGAMILPTTAAANGGLCMPCKRGFRGRIDEGRLRHAQRKATLANSDPATKHWRWLVQEAYRTPGGFERLSLENQNFFAAFLLEGEVYNGGLEQYFFNSSANFYAHALRGLAEIGATECRDILVAAKEVFFGAGEPPAARAERLEVMKKTTPAQEQQLAAFDRRFNAAAAQLGGLGRDYALRHGLWDGF